MKILRKSRAQFPKVSVFIGQKLVFCHYCIQNAKNWIQLQVYNISNKCVTHFSQFISEKVKKSLRTFQSQFWEKLRKLRLRQNNGFLREEKVLFFFTTFDFCML